jgi:hypothetical protein
LTLNSPFNHQYCAAGCDSVSTVKHPLHASQVLPPDLRVLWVVSPGGHLAQSLAFEDLRAPHEAAGWIVPDTLSSRSQLYDADAAFVGHFEASKVRSWLSSISAVRRASRSKRFDVVASVGAGIAIPALLAARMSRQRAVYIESFTRVTALSKTGKLIKWIPGVERFVQHQGLESRRFRPISPVTTLVNKPAESNLPENRTVLVMLGTHTDFPFTRALTVALGNIGPTDSVTWVLGSTPPLERLRGRIEVQIPHAELTELIDHADVVITHAGVGSLLDCFRAGVKPWVIVRDASRGEHIDPHQRDLADALLREGWIREIS